MSAIITPRGIAAVDCGSLLPLLPTQPAARRCGASANPGLHPAEVGECPAPRRSRLRPPQRQQAAAVHGRFATDPEEFTFCIV